jgi:hypothetical protein
MPNGQKGKRQERSHVDTCAIELITIHQTCFSWMWTLMLFLKDGLPEIHNGTGRGE